MPLHIKRIMSSGFGIPWNRDQAGTKVLKSNGKIELREIMSQGSVPTAGANEEWVVKLNSDFMIN